MLRKYYDYVSTMLEQVIEANEEVLPKVIDETARRVREDKLIYVYGPGGHANIATQEAFFRAGGLMNIAAILDEARCSRAAPCGRCPWSAPRATAGSSSTTPAWGRATSSSSSTPTG